ncbi:MAG TPA: hypothetical protein VKB35_06255 [Ktedonobacteraceae bacterium]|nr:hypothetical protein [Ktedonobacteraceae bacterium]
MLISLYLVGTWHPQGFEVSPGDRTATTFRFARPIESDELAINKYCFLDSPIIIITSSSGHYIDVKRTTMSPVVLR